MNGRIIGSCLSMCPEKERRMRETEGLLHKFEYDEKTKHMKKPRADPGKTIKSYARSAAGQVMTDPSQLRPASVLLGTVRYLFTEIATRTDASWVCIYDFIFDRLRSVRQDIVIQRIDVHTAIQLFEPLVRFHTYAAERLREMPILVYDPKINSHHLLECITHLLMLYDKRDEELKRDLNDSIGVNVETLTLEDNRPQMEALYILLNLGDVAALNRGLMLPSKLKNEDVIQLAMKISLAWYFRNYVRVCRLIQQLPPLLICAAMCEFSKLRRDTLQIMSSAYNNPVLSFPGLKLQELLLYKDISRVEVDCNIFNLTFSGENIIFQKNKFNQTVAVSKPEAYYTDAKLHQFLPQILLQCT